MKNTYETIIILDPLNYTESKDKFEKMCQSFYSRKIKVDNLGVKKLAYPIKEKFTEGYYVVFTWVGTAENVAELERNMRIDDNVLKFISVKKDDDDEDYPESQMEESEQPEYNPNIQVDAMDVMLGFADYTKKEVS